MGRMDGKVAVISGAARGQGRSHALTLAQEGAQIVAFDICEALRSPAHPPATEADLEETVRLVEAEDRRCIGVKCDARDADGLAELTSRTIAEFGRIDTLVINHGIWSVDRNAWSMSEADWEESISVLLTGPWQVAKAFIPPMIEAGNGGSIIITSSTSGERPQPGSAAYVAGKHGVMGLMKTLAYECGEHDIRVNAVLPGAVDTQIVAGGTLEQTMEDWPKFYDRPYWLLPGDELQPPASISNAVLFLASDEARWITGAGIPVDRGLLLGH
jgi:SDR family mycofactocin-dependent oxidoreductase